MADRRLEAKWEPVIWSWNLFSMGSTTQYNCWILLKKNITMFYIWTFQKWKFGIARKLFQWLLGVWLYMHTHFYI